MAKNDIYPDVGRRSEWRRLFSQVALVILCLLAALGIAVGILASAALDIEKRLQPLALETARHAEDQLEVLAQALADQSIRAAPLLEAHAALASPQEPNGVRTPLFAILDAKGGVIFPKAARNLVASFMQLPASVVETRQGSAQLRRVDPKQYDGVVWLVTRPILSSGGDPLGTAALLIEKRRLAEILEDASDSAGGRALVDLEAKVFASDADFYGLPDSITWAMPWSARALLDGEVRGFRSVPGFGPAIIGAYARVGDWPAVAVIETVGATAEIERRLRIALGLLLAVAIAAIAILVRGAAQHRYAKTEPDTEVDDDVPPSSVGVATFAWCFEDRHNAHYSPAWRHLVGSDDEPEPDLEEWEARLHPDDRLRVLRTLQQAIDSGVASLDQRYRLLDAHHNEVAVKDVTTLVPSPKGSHWLAHRLEPTAAAIPVRSASPRPQ